MYSSREAGEKVSTSGQFGDPQFFHFLIDFDIKKKISVKAWSWA